MKNKLKTKPVNNQRYLKGLSLAEQDDVEQAVEYALEDPGGTFTRVSQEHSAKLSAMNKTVKSISGDTKYIRKAVDKFDKKLDALQQAFEDGGGGGAGGIGDAFPWRTGASPARAAGASRLGSLLKGAGGLLLLGGALYAIDESAPSIISKIDKMRPDNSKPMPKIETGWGKGLIGTDIAGAAGQATREWVIKKYKDMFGNTTSPAKQKNSISNRISYQQNNFFQQAQGNNTRGIPELTPSERAIIIRERLKGMTQIPGMQTGGFAGNHMQVEGIPNARGSLGWGPGRPNMPPGSTGSGTTPAAPSAVISDGGIGGTKDGGRTGKQNGINAPGSLDGKKGKARNQQEAYNALRADGLSVKAAKILVANLSGENLANPNGKPYSDPSRRNPNQTAGGAAAWDDTRRARIAKQFGKSPEHMTIPEQMKALTWEMKTHYKTAWSDLNNESLTDEQRMFTVVKKFESPKNPELRSAERLANIDKMGVTDGPQVAVGASAIHAAKNVKPGEGPLAGPTAVVENQGTNARTRKRPIQPELTAVLDYAAKQAGVDKVEVFSGGQAGKGEGGPRTGSTRHDHGKAGDVYLWKDGKKVNMNTADGREIMKKFATASRQAGATGIGAGSGYMGPEAMHVGFGKEATWGGADWLADSYAQGKALPPVNAMALMQENKKAAETVVASNNTPIPRALMRNKPVPAAQTAAAETSAYGKWRAEKDKGAQSVARAKSYALYDDIKNPERKFPEWESTSATPNLDAAFARQDAAIAAKKAADKRLIDDREFRKAPLPLTPAEQAGKGDMGHVPTGLERLRADTSTVGLGERAKAYAMNMDKYPQPERIFPNARPQQSIPQQVTRPVAAQVVPEPDGGGMLQAAQDMAQAAIDKAKEATAMVTEYIQGAKEVVPQSVNRIPKTSKNPPPLTNPPRTYHRATQTTNPTAKTPGSDSSKSFGTTTESEAAWQYPAIEMGVP